MKHERKVYVAPQLVQIVVTPHQSLLSDSGIYIIDEDGNIVEYGGVDDGSHDAGSRRRSYWED